MLMFLWILFFLCLKKDFERSLLDYETNTNHNYKGVVATMRSDNNKTPTTKK